MRNISEETKERHLVKEEGFSSMKKKKPPIMCKFSTFLMNCSVDCQTTQMRTRSPERSDMELFVTIANGFQSLIIVTNSSALDIV